MPIELGKDNTPLSIEQAHKKLDIEKNERKKKAKEQREKAKIGCATPEDMYKFISYCAGFLKEKDDRIFIDCFIGLCQYMEREDAYKRMSEEIFKKNDERHINIIKEKERKILEKIKDLISQKVGSGMPIIGGL